MGTWGAGLYANDTTCDVRDSYIQFLQEGLCNDEAYKKILNEYKEYIGEQDEPLFWYALAETQWKVGRLVPEVKEKALKWIDKCGGIELWEESTNKGAGWEKTLEKLKIKLLSTMPPEKKLRKPQTVNNNLWNVNDIYAYQFNGKEAKKKGYSGKYILIQKIDEGMNSFDDTLTMKIQVMDKLFDKHPTLEDFDKLRILPLDFPERVNMKKNLIWMSALILVYKKSFYPTKNLIFIGNKQGPSNNMSTHNEMVWSHVDTVLYDFYKLWEGIEYETIGDGIYRYNRE